MKQYKSSVLLAIAAIGLVVLGACRKEPLNNLSNEESRIYETNFDSTAQFGSYKTFSVADSADVLEDGQYAGKILTDYEAKLIAALKQSMAGRGYSLVARTANPDLAINITEVVNTQTAVFSYGDYWGDYGYYYDPYYWGYPGYSYYSPYAYAVYSVQSAAEIDLLDLKNAATNGNKIKGLWSGLVQGEDVFNPNNAAPEVAALFAQSAYLKTNN
ncbi:MAG TPA: DUF4136 domain-containing protein [Puia sp.]|nr:DUF4136 domain-containing protein [Puia sp.]